MTSKQIIIMKTTKFLINIGLVFMLLLLLVFASCKKDVVEVIPEDTTPEFVFLSNGNSVSTSMGFCSLTHISNNGTIWTQLELVANFGANSFRIKIFNIDVQNPPMGGVKTKIYYSNPEYANEYLVNGISINDACIAVLNFNSKVYQSTVNSSRTDNVQITSCDNIAKKVSGNYRFTVKDIGNPNDSLILSGYFNHQNYVVINKSNIL